MRSTLFLMLIVFASAAYAAEPTATGSIDPNDPLFKAVQELNRDLQQLRQEINAKSPGAKTTPPAMSAPAMPAPAMNAPPARPLASSAKPVIASVKPRAAAVDV